MSRYIMHVIADDEYVVTPKVCCDCRQLAMRDDGSLCCGLGGKDIPDGIDTQEPQNYLCPVIKSKKVGFLGEIILNIIMKDRVGHRQVEKKQVTAEWKEEEGAWGISFFECSNCGYTALDNTEICPRCKASMGKVK